MDLPSTTKEFVVGFGRVAWRLVVYFAILIGAFWLLSRGYAWGIHEFEIRFPHGPQTRPAEAVALAQARLLIGAIVASMIAGRLGRDQVFSMLRLDVRGGAHLMQGIFWGFVAIALTIGAIAAFGGYRVSGIASSGPSLAYYAPLWVVTAVVNGLAENLALLGYPLFVIGRAAGWRPAIIAAALLFAAAHLGSPGENVIGIVSIFLIALVMAITVWLTRNLWLSVGIHGGIIIAEDLVFSVPDSGAIIRGTCSSAG